MEIFSVLAEADQILNNCYCLSKKSVSSSELVLSKGEDTAFPSTILSHICNVNINAGTCLLSSQNVKKISFSINIFSPFFGACLVHEPILRKETFFTS